MLRAIKPIRHDGIRYEPGDTLPGMGSNQSDRLIECGAAESIVISSEKAVASTTASTGSKTQSGKKPASPASKTKITTPKGAKPSDKSSTVQLPAGIDSNLVPKE